MKAAFRVDASPYIGMGHLMRCMALAAAFQRAGHEVVFFSRFEPGILRISLEGFAVRSFRAGQPDGLGREYEPARDTMGVISLLKEERPDILVTDSYRVDSEYFRETRRVVRMLAYVDDVNRFTADVDILVNGNIYGDTMDYAGYGLQVRKLLGCKYNLIRSQFRNLPDYEVKERVEDILLTGGGGDPVQALTFLAESLLNSAKFHNCRLHLVLPIGNNPLPAKLNSHPRIIRHVAVREMAALMRRCDLALSAAGSTLYELCAAGVPRMAYIVADNQTQAMVEMERQGQAEGLGLFGKMSTEDVVVKCADLAEDMAKRRIMSRQGRKLVDGNGPDRVVEACADFLRNNERSGRT